MSRFPFLITLVLLAAPALADAVYSYTGQPFDTEVGTPLYLANPTFKLGQSISFTINFPAPLPPGLVSQSIVPTTWSLNVGGTVYRSGESGVTLSNAIVSTDSAGRIDDWLFSVFVSPNRQFSTA